MKLSRYGPFGPESRACNWEVILSTFPDAWKDTAGRDRTVPMMVTEKKIQLSIRPWMNRNSNRFAKF
jgi:hypothetical protein